MSERETPVDRHRRIAAAAQEFGHVLSRRRLRELGVNRDQEAAQVAAGRWAMVGKQTLSMHTGPLDDVAQRWRAVWETGHLITQVDGVSALQAAGLKGWTEDVVHVSVLHRHNVKPVGGVHTHKVIRRVSDERIDSGLPRTRPAHAAIRAAHWAKSNRAAATILAMSVQQRLVTGPQLVSALAVVRGRNRRAFIRQAVMDIADGAQALGELDFAAACRKRGLPVPSRQVLRRVPGGRVYLDVYFEEYGLVVEIDGAGHEWGMSPHEDNLRENQVVIDGDRVIRINVMGMRVEEDVVMDQVVAALGSEWAQANLARHRAART